MIKKILMVEDNQEDVFFYEYLFEQKKKAYSLIITDKKETALSYIQNNDIDCVFSDFNLSLWNTLQLLTDLNNNKISIPPYIILTGQIDDDNKEKALSLGATLCALKENINSIEKIEHIIDDAFNIYNQNT